MRKYGVTILGVIFISTFFMPAGSALLAQDGGMRTEAIRNAYRQLLAAADKNGDGKISLQECRALSTAAEMEKNCRYWDANGDGVITEQEYVQQVLKIGNAGHPAPRT